MTIRVVSLNCWGGRVPAVVDFLPMLNADILCLQEMFWTTGAGVSTLQEPPYPQDELPVMVDLFSDIERRMPTHRGYFYPSCRRYINDSTRVDVDLYYGLAMFVRKTLPVVQSVHGQVHGVYSDLAPEELPFPRTGHAVKIHRGKEKPSLVVAHMHGLWIPEGKMDTRERVKQAHRFGGLVHTLARNGEDIVMCGDFNLLPNSESFKIWEARLNVRDLVTDRGFTNTRTSLYKKNVSRYADYMLVSPYVHVANFDVLANPEVSDHRPLVLDLE